MLNIALALFAALTFANIPWNSPPDVVVKKLKDAGFTDIKKQRPDLTFHGTFLNHKAVGTATMVDKKLAKVVILLAITDDVPRTGYEEVRAALIEKYGEPQNTVVKFKEPFHENDGWESEAIRTGGALFATQWRDEEGRSVTCHITTDLAVAITYE